VGVWSIFTQAVAWSSKTWRRGKIVQSRGDFFSPASRTCGRDERQIHASTLLRLCFGHSLFRFVSFPLARFNYTPSPSYIFSLFCPGEQSCSKERPKERPRPNRQRHAETAAALSTTVAAACRPKPCARIQQGASLLIWCAFPGAAKVPGVHVHVVHILKSPQRRLSQLDRFIRAG
jgi:hypothetical protein